MSAGGAERAKRRRRLLPVSSGGARGLALAALAFVALFAPSAQAFAPEARPWQPTPERFLRTAADHPQAVRLPSLEAAGLSPWSYRLDGRPAFAFAARGALAIGPLALELAAAEALALELARASAPALGISASDLVLDETVAFDGWTMVTLGQRHRGVPVRGGFLLFSFADGRLVAFKNELLLPEALPEAPVLSSARAEAIALEVAAKLSLEVQLAAAPSLEVWVGGDRPSDARLAFAVRVRAFAPRAELEIHVDATTGAVLAVDDEVRHADGETRLRIHADPVTAGSAKAAFTTFALAVQNQATDGDGEVRSTGAQQLTYEGPLVRIADASGAPLERLQASFVGPFRVQDLVPQNYTQADPFVHLSVVKQRALELTPGLQWLRGRLTANVNLGATCNAFWDGSTVNFYREGGGCNNTGRIASIVIHEFGHGYHQFLTRNVVGSVGEGSGDFLAATILDDPVVGRGFSTNGSGIRRIDQRRVYPDHYRGDVHNDGLIWGSALWALRRQLMEKHGDVQGRRWVERAFAVALAQGPGLSTAYPAILLADDDDQNPSNGTPNSCEINAIFEAHGLVRAGQINHTPVPVRPFVRILHEAPGRLGIEGGVVRLEARAENRSSCGSFELGALRLHYARGEEPAFTEAQVRVEGAVARVELEGLRPGDALRYWWSLAAGGAVFTSGDGDRPHLGWVELPDELLFAEGFEEGFGAWRHGTVGSDLEDDWEVGAPLGLRGDPVEARAGQRVAGTDLGAGGRPGGTNGAAKPGRRSFLESPPIVTEGMDEIRLELWLHHALRGRMEISVEGTTVWEHQSAGAGSGGWRFLSVPLGPAARDRAEGVVVRFEVNAAGDNDLGGLTIDALEVRGRPIPKDLGPISRGEEPALEPGAEASDPPAFARPPASVAVLTPDPSIDGGGAALARRGLAGGCRCAPQRSPPAAWGALLLAATGVWRGSRRRR